jgi:hypothetical protein
LPGQAAWIIVVNTMPLDHYVRRILRGGSTSLNADERMQFRLQAILISLLIGLAYLLLFTFRALDDNRLVSWSWVFHGFPTLKFAFLLLAASLISYPLSRSALLEKAPSTFLLLASFFLSALLWDLPEVIIDSARYFAQAKYLQLHGAAYFLREWGNEIEVWTDLPLVPFIYGLIFRVFGEYRIVIQLFNTLMFAGTAVLTCQIGNRLGGKNIGLHAGLLLLAMPYLVLQVPLMMTDIAAMFFLTLAIFATMVAVERENTAFCLFASVAILLAMLTKYSNWLMLSIVPVILLVNVPAGWLRCLRCGVTIIVGVILPLGVLMLLKLDVLVDQMRLLHEFQAPALYRWQESWLSTFFFQLNPVVALSALFSIYLAIVKKDIRYLVAAWLILLILLLEIKRIRYSIAALPMLAIMASYGISGFGSQATRKFIVTSTTLTAILLTVSAYIPFLENNSAANIRQAGLLLDSMAAESAEVFILPQSRSTLNPLIALPLLDLFTKKDIVYRARNDIESPRDISRLPWRWTWEVTNRHYRADRASKESSDIVVLIHSRSSQQTSPWIEQSLRNYHLLHEFNRFSGAFRFKTFVSVYRRARAVP